MLDYFVGINGNVGEFVEYHSANNICQVIKYSHYVKDVLDTSFLFTMKVGLTLW